MNFKIRFNKVFYRQFIYFTKHPIFGFGKHPIPFDALNSKPFPGCHLLISDSDKVYAAIVELSEPRRAIAADSHIDIEKFFQRF